VLEYSNFDASQVEVARLVRPAASGWSGGLVRGPGDLTARALQAGIVDRQVDLESAASGTGAGIERARQRAGNLQVAVELDPENVPLNAPFVSVFDPSAGHESRTSAD
jgi:hypothetical protein